ncbi:MAG: tetratricopeptide repeat protein [Leptospiraceae bacterium]|nr:tetratricopeptide repeat protein [Leptospiraceae bacterium]MCP5496315.1 tetratricopeptide repeat protein [Leptospiraceae bacterium]
MNDLPILSFLYCSDEAKLLEKVEKNFQCLGYIIKNYVCDPALEPNTLKGKNVDEKELLLPIVSDSLLKKVSCFNYLISCLNHYTKILPIVLDVSGYGKNNDFKAYLELKAPEKSNLEILKNKTINCISLDELAQEHYQTIFAFLEIETPNIPPLLIKINKLRNPESQEKGLEELRKEEPQNRTILFSSAFLQYENENIETAKKYLDKLLALYPDDTMANYLYANLLQKHYRDFENAKKRFESAISNYSNSDKIHYEYAIFLEKNLNYYQQAKQEYEQAIRLFPCDSNYHYHYALLLVEKFRDYEIAKKYFQKSLQLEPNFVDAHYNYALLLVTLQDYKEAREHYELALKINPNFVYAHNNYAYLLETQFQEYEKAKKHYEFVLKLDPNFAYAHFNYALFLYERQNDLTGAKHHYQAACKIEPKLKNQEIENLLLL